LTRSDDTLPSTLFWVEEDGEIGIPQLFRDPLSSGLTELGDEQVKFRGKGRGKPDRPYATCNLYIPIPYSIVVDEVKRSCD
jgi:hypothetical protein